MTCTSKTTRTTCPYCGVGCGVLATTKADGSVQIAGDPEHPANFGRLCSKGSSLGETLSLEDRLLHPHIAGQRATWDTALDLVADTFRKTIAAHGPDSVAFYVSGQILTEDYYVANKLMKGFIGSANIDTNSRLCMASSVAGHRRAFGTDTVPGTYEDLERADLIVLVGSNLAWCHPVLFQRIEAEKRRRPSLRLVVIDPRRTATCELADLHLKINPDTDVTLFNGLLAFLADTAALDARYINRFTTGFDAALEAAGACDIPELARKLGVAPQDLALFYTMVARTPKTVTVYSQGVNQSITGSDKVNAILNTHLATGRIGKPGMGPFSVTGQPNAMGGREVGGLANMLAAHMDLENPNHRKLVQNFWQSPTIADKPGLKAIELFNAVRDGQVKALWIMGTNPVDSLPDADTVAAALKACPFVVVSEVSTAVDTAAYAHVLLPGAAWGEKDGTVTNSERRISRQRSFLDLPGDTRPDWWALVEVARRMGFAAQFDYDTVGDIFVEHAALSGHENNGQRDFDIGALSGLSPDAYQAMEPVQWPHSKDIAKPEQGRFFANGGFFTDTGKGRFLPVTSQEPRKHERKYPLVLNTGRIRDQWHTMTRTGKTPRLTSHIAEPFAEIHPDDAAQLGIKAADLVEVASAHGRIKVRALLTERVRTGSVFVPMHWTDQFASNARVDTLVEPATDPVSGQPGSKYTGASLRKLSCAWYGFAVLAEKPAKLSTSYWAVAPAVGGWRVELAGLSPATPAGILAELLGEEPDPTQMVSLATSGGVAGRCALWQDGRLKAALFVDTDPVAVSRQWAVGLLSQTAETPMDRLKALAGRPSSDRPDPGAIVCSCFQIGANQIAAEVRSGDDTLDGIGKALGAGTNCGSCRSEICSLIASLQEKETENGDIAQAG